MGATQAKSSIQRSTLSAKWKRLTTRRNCATPPPAAPPLERAKSLKYPRQKSLAPMPRCSSFSGNAPDDGAPSLVAPTKKSLNDPSYTLWKTAFEEDWPELPLAWPHQQRTRIHDMSEAVAGQLTPKGFPSYTDLTRSSNGGSPLPAANKKPEVIYATVRRRLSLRLPKLNASRKQEVRKVEQRPIVPAEQKPVATAAHRPSIPPTANLAEKPAVRADNLAAKKQTTISININILRTSNKDTTPKQAAAQESVSNQQNMHKPGILLNHVGMQPHHNVVSTTTTTTKPQATLKPAVTTTGKPHFLSKLPKEQADVIEKLYLDIRAAECCGMPLNYYYL